jgi:hypothetical protein
VDIAAAQRDVRTVYAGGSYGQLVSGMIWLVAAGVSVVVSHVAGIVVLLTFGVRDPAAHDAAAEGPGRAHALPKGHPMAPLAMQIAFTVPLGLLVAVAAAGYREEWFFPASMVIVGAHYLPFTFLYGMPLFAVLGGLMTLGGLALALWLPNAFSHRWLADRRGAARLRRPPAPIAPA